MGIAIVLAIRLSAPLCILRWPFAGSLVALVADGVDIIIFQLTDPPSIGYQRFDKLLDVYYISLQAIVAQRWAPAPRWTANALFAYRIAGTALYEITNTRPLLLLFPNLFVFFFVFHAGVLTFRPDYEMTPRRIAAWLAALLVPSLALEYTLHYARWLDNLVAVDIIEDVSRAVIGWLTDRVP